MTPDVRRVLLVILVAACLIVFRGIAHADAPTGPGLIATCDGRMDTLFGHAVYQAKAHRLPRHLVAAVAWRESRWDTQAVNGAGWYPARGLMQIVERFHPTMRGRTFEPCASLDYGAGYLADLLWQYDGSLWLALHQYSGGATGYYENVIAYMLRVERPTG